jgi:ribosome-associated toxin RatA of RatAB toxin-antitoxin module
MKDLHGTASSPVAASAAEAYALVLAVEDYPRWYPEVVKEVQVTERTPDGSPSHGRAKLAVAYGPLARDFDLTLQIEASEPERVVLRRIPHEPSDPERFQVTWTIGEGAITVSLDARLSVPRLLPVGGIGEAMASGFVEAAARALSRTR